MVEGSPTTSDAIAANDAYNKLAKSPAADIALRSIILKPEALHQEARGSGPQRKVRI